VTDSVFSPEPCIETKNLRGYTKSFLFAASVLILGLLFEIISGGKGISLPKMPLNIYAGFSFVVLLVFLHLFYHRHAFVRWLSGVPAAVSSISLFALLVLLLGFIPQKETHGGILSTTGLDHLKTSWPFFFSQVYILSSLGLVILRRLNHLTLRNVGFFLNHAGLWLVIASGGLGSSDLMRLQIELYEGKPFTNLAHDQVNRYRLPFSLKLNDFILEEYPPRIAFADARTFQIIPEKNISFIPAEPGKRFPFKEFVIQVDTVLMHALSESIGMKAVPAKDGVPACHITVFRASSVAATGWIACGNRSMHPVILPLNDTIMIALLDPEPRKYQSLLEIINRNDTIPAVLEVNKPIKIRGWQLYQMGYDQMEGRNSQLSIIEAVNDPWLPVVYTGIFMLLAGAVYLFWLGQGNKNKQKQ